jgi:hypothetical protein
MRIAPSDRFLAVCRAVLGDDDPATVLGVMRSTDRELIERLMQAHRDIIDCQNGKHTPASSSES